MFMMLICKFLKLEVRKLGLVLASFILHQIQVSEPTRIGSGIVQVMGLTWGVWDESIFTLRPQIILGADVLYDTSAFDNLFATVKFLLEKSPGSVFITSYHNRSGHRLIEFLMVKWGLKCVKLIDGFSFLPSWKASGLSGNIQLVEIGPGDVGKN